MENPKVLVVEDDTDISYIICLHLEAEGFSCAVATGVVEAWNALERETPAAAIVDLTLSGEPDWSLIERIRRDRRFSRLPIVVTTGHVGADFVRRAAALGCEHLPKPFEFDDLRASIDRAIGQVPSPGDTR